ncbi:Ig-like domain-containing protein [Bifidobacterium aerophilum]|uniref:LamG-like jellyroll fold domain-containing protein n=1 Tax=Bifidobacterium aerophilum TaxID=1798155 RepID=A0A6N9Z3E5_9BIFI|nr:Ig-like domain-containing protein [Bifidobacterium aerophilum]NEG88950.1 hypothetical protein [Bifidobacterium aerophilum]
MQHRTLMLRAIGGLAAVSMLMPAVSAQALDVPESVPTPLVSYSFEDDISTGVIANGGSAGAALNGRLENPALAAQGSSAATGKTLKLPGGAKNSGGDHPLVWIPNGVFRQAQGLTVSAWVKWDGSNAKDNPVAWYLGGDKLAKNTSGTFFNPSDGGKMTVTTDNGLTGSASATQSKAQTAEALPSNTWKYVTATQTDSELTVYVNGEKVSSAAAKVDFTNLHNDASTFSGVIGNGTWPKWTAYYGGEIDDFAIWNSALDSDQVKEVFDGYTVDQAVPKTVAPVQATVDQGFEPELPATVDVTYSDGSKKSLDVTWDSYDWKNAPSGDVTVHGAIQGIELKATATVTVVKRKIVSINPVNIKIDEGQSPALPYKVKVVYGSGADHMTPVTWPDMDWPNKKPGTYMVDGLLDGSDTKVPATVTISAVRDVKPVVVSKAEKAAGSDRGSLYVDGKPFNFVGVQFFGEWQTFGDGHDPNNIKHDQDHPVLEQDWLENGFEKVAAAGFKTIQIETAWNQIEPEAPGQYDWHRV